MPLEKIPARDVYDRLGANKQRNYPSANRGAERLQPYAQPAVRAGFAFDADSTIFATGSCFARNVEKSLRFIDANVVSSPVEVLKGHDGPSASNLFNKYTVHSILNEFRWALSGQPVDHAASLVADRDGRYYDLQVTAAKDVSGTLEEMTAFRAAYNGSFARAGTADVVIMTLGLVECWFDTQTGLYLNAAPPKPLTLLYPDRFEFHRLDYADVLAALEEIHGLLTAGKASPPRILVTVSPVGLMSTFTDQDVLVANTYSKAVQRAAVEAYVTTHDASYFPSYEYVTLTDHKFAWTNKDFRHVRQETVDRIMADVLLAYVGESPQQRLLYTRGHATAKLEYDEADAACALIEAYAADQPLDGELLWIYAQALRKTGRRQECIDTCVTMIDMGTDYDRPAARTALAAMKQLGLVEEMRALAEWYRDNMPDDQDYIAPFLAA